MKVTTITAETAAKELYAQIRRGQLSPAAAAKQIAAFKENARQGEPEAPVSSGVTFVHNEPFLRDHTLGGKQIVIGVAHASLAIDDYFLRFPADSAVSLRQLTFIQPIEVGPAQQAEVKVEREEAAGSEAFVVKFRLDGNGEWQATARGQSRRFAGEFGRQDLAALKAAAPAATNPRAVYEAGEPYFKVGPAFRAIRQLFSGRDTALAELDLTDALQTASRAYGFQPLIIYSAFTALVPLLESAGFRDPFLPFGIKELDFRKGYPLEKAWVAVRLARNTGEMVFFDARVLTPQGDEVAILRGASIKRLRANTEFSTIAPALAPRVPVKPGGEPDAASAIRAYLAATLGLPSASVDWDRNLMELGLASAQLVELAGKIASEKGIELEPTLFFEYPTLRELAGYFQENHSARFVESPRFSPAFNPPTPRPELSPARLVSTPPATPAREPAVVDGIAVIGMDGRFAGAANLDEFWENLRTQKELIGEVPRDHWDYRPWFDPNPAALDKTCCKWGSFIDGVDQFDPAFFNIPPDEARWLDPQVRLLLQSVQAAAENAGVARQLKGTATGVFIGICSNDYQDRIAELGLPVDPRRTGVGGSDTAANRVSYWLDLKGPSLVFNTACSSSLFALHYACQALQRGECEMAFVSSANLLLSSRHYRHFSAIRALSPTGRCRPFDHAADGYVPGECVGAVLLKPLAQAIRDGDPIHAVIKGSAALHAGRAPALTAPSVSGQENVLLKAWADAGIDPRTLSYVECHGTGTKLGDSVELAALRKALAHFDAPDKCCGVGSVKANLGHTEGAAGLAGLLKVILQMQHREIPAMPHFHQPNEYLRLEGSPVWLRSEAGSWEPQEGPLRAGVSAFGFSGSYAHVVVEEAPPAVRPSTDKRLPLGQVAIVLSARTEDRLREMARKLFQFLQNASNLNLEDIAYTLQVGREPMTERLAFAAGSMAELKEHLRAFAETGAASPPLYRGRPESDNAALSRLAADEDMAATFQAWFQKGRLDRLLELWVRGCDIDWNALHGPAHPARIALPTYPFAPERFWLPEAGAPEAAAEFDAPKPEPPATNAPEAWQFSPAGEGEAGPGDEMAPAAKAELIVRQSVATHMQCPVRVIRADSSFLELPLGSLGLVETLQTVGRILEEPLSPALLFEHASVSALAAHLAREYASKINRVRAKRITVPVDRPALEQAFDGICPLSEGQKGLWALQKAAPAMAAYNCPLGFRVNGPLDIPCFHKAFEFLLRWQPLLTSRIVDHNGTPGFIAQPADSVKVRTVDARGWSERQVQDWLKQEAKAPFDLDQAALLRAALLLISENETVVLFTVHHIVFDGSSFALFMKGLLEAYHQLRTGRQPELPPPAASYSDYVNLERSRLEGGDGARRVAFWKEQLSGERLPLEIPLDFPRSQARPFAGQTVSFTVGPEIARGVRLLAKKHGLYESSVFLALFQELLSLYANQKDIVVGMPVNERAGARFQSLIGYFVNMVPIRSREIGGQPFVEFARTVQQTMLAALANRYPFPALVRELKLSGQGAHPVFQAAFEFQNFLRPEEAEAVNQAIEQAFPITWIEGLHQEGEYELALEVIAQAEGYQLNLKFNPTLLGEGTAARMVSQLGRLLESALSQPRRLPGAELLLTPAERHALLVEWNDTACDYPKDACIHHFFEAQARKTPQAVAASFGEKTLTYRELDRRGTQLALQLQQLGVQPDAIVGLFLERSLEMIVAILGVLKAGGAYMPLDPDYPAERLAFMVGDSKTSWILTQSHLAAKVTPLQAKATQVLYLDGKGLAGGGRGKVPRAPKREVQARHLAYVLYTSGSTGVSKGVMVEHQALCNRILWMQREYGLTKADRVLQKTPFSFDVSGWEFHWPLMAGARLEFAAPGKHKDPEYLRDLIQARAITVLHFVPSMLQAFLGVDRVQECRTLRQVFCSGEELTPVQAARFFERFDKTELHNLYGPTEAAIDVTSKQCVPGARITIGKPIANVRLYVVDPQLRLLPAGLPGELCLAGDALARGYLNRPELTAEKFVDNPFEPGARLYRTGDLARWTPEGEIQFLGRLDHQVKIRGCRIELGEIETVLQGLAGVRDAVVVPRGEGESKKLAAFYVATGPAISLPWFRQQLKLRLPEHMIPSEFIALDCLPLTPSGKVDRRNLAQRPTRAASPDASAEAETPTQSRLKALWREALAVEKIGLRDSFFDLGGHSLSALSLMAKVNAEFKTHLPLATLFEAKSVAELAARLEANAAPEANSYLVALEARGSRPPLYLVPGIGGGASSFLPLSRALGSEQPVYAFQPPGRQGECAPLASIQELAAFYLERLPLLAAGMGYCLGGWSLGGVIAYEMACQLVQQGRPVDRLILIDSYLPEHFERFSRIAGKYSFHFSVENHLPESGGGSYAQYFAAVQAAHQRALANYRATQVFPGDVCYFYATEHAGSPDTTLAKQAGARLRKETQAIWAKYLPRLAAGFVPVKGAHDSILQVPAVLSVARQIQDFAPGPWPAKPRKRSGKTGGRS